MIATDYINERIRWANFLMGWLYLGIAVAETVRVRGAA